MSEMIYPKKIRDIQGQMRLCNIHKIELIEEYFNHIIVPCNHKPNPDIEYDFRYEIKVSGKCEMPDCPREAYCIMFNGVNHG